MFSPDTSASTENPLPAPELVSSLRCIIKLLTVLLVEHWHKQLWWNKNYTELHQEFGPEVKNKWKTQSGIKSHSSQFTVKGFCKNWGNQ